MTDTNIDYKPFTVQAGKRYNRADGGVSGVLAEKRNSDTHSFEEEGGWAYAYMANGRFFSTGGPNPYDLISEYKEQPVSPEAEFRKQCHDAADATDTPAGKELIYNGDFYIGGDGWTKTAEPQDEWGPWIFYGQEDFGSGVECQLATLDGEYANKDWSNVIAYRIKKEPEVFTDKIWIFEKTGEVFDVESYNESHKNCDGYRKAIITLTDGKLDTDWADEGEDQ